MTGGLVASLGGDRAALLAVAAVAALTFIAFGLFARPVRPRPAGRLNLVTPRKEIR